MNHFVLVVSIVNTVWALLWDRKNWHNVIVKLGFAGLAIWGWYLLFHA